MLETSEIKTEVYKKNVELNRKNHGTALDDLKEVKTLLGKKTGVPINNTVAVMKALKHYRQCLERGIDLI